MVVHSENSLALTCCIAQSGQCALKIPYSNDTELVMDILRYGAGVKVTAPPSLAERITNEIESMQQVYVRH